jgi:hypothetical protein
MTRGPCHVRQHDIDVIYKAARKFGYSEVKIELDINSGKITATARSDGSATNTTINDCASNGRANEWDKI